MIRELSLFCYYMALGVVGWLIAGFLLSLAGDSVIDFWTSLQITGIVAAFLVARAREKAEGKQQ